MTVDAHEQSGARPRNWGRWGASDERGAANLLSPANVATAAGLVSDGVVFELGQTIGRGTPIPAHRPAPAHFMLRDGGDAPTRPLAARFADDVVLLATHTGTHVDALAHVWHGDELYNGFPSTSIRSNGARHCGIEKLGPLVGRGVLLDVAAASGVLALDDGAPVTASALERCTKAQGVEIRPGDIVLLRTGWWTARATDPGQAFAREPGPDLDAARWLAAHDVAAVGADNFAFEVLPAAGERTFPVHELLLRDCGIPIMEGLVLDELARAQVNEFLFVAAPLAILGATASPVNPLAVT